MESVERGHMAVENIGEHQRMLRKKFYITDPRNINHQEEIQ